MRKTRSSGAAAHSDCVENDEEMVNFRPACLMEKKVSEKVIVRRKSTADLEKSRRDRGGHSQIPNSSLSSSDSSGGGLVRFFFGRKGHDIPDIDGDKIFGIRSFTVRLGQERVFWICISLLEMAYCVAVLVGAASSSLWSRYLTVSGHAVLAAILWNRAKSMDLKSKAAITSFYMFIWKLFYAEYLLIPLVR
ncbi:hypothetical protein RHMOL_Rhmol03G0292300 [Rhododendron molle]|uniref:Uncharacterized protein n=1 Tax=Rhododendron molle TaxID=49168 RepID=A0ACC0PL17_RHOML|nr:hypothetical protein RHMOL_Rhmol03G0292300 [Rhododendron molle]